jgi:hypothetical protein
VTAVETLSKLLAPDQLQPEDRIKLVAEMVNNQVLVSTSPHMTDTVTELLRQLDQAPPVAVVDVLIVEVVNETGTQQPSAIADIRQHGSSPERIAELLQQVRGNPSFRIIADLALNVVNNQAAFVQLGKRPTSLAEGSAEKVRADADVDKLVLGVTARISHNNFVTMEVDVEIDRRLQDDPSESDAHGARIDSIKTATTLAAPSGQASLLGGLRVHDAAGEQDMFIIVTPHVVEQ